MTTAVGAVLGLLLAVAGVIGLLHDRHRPDPPSSGTPVSAAPARYGPLPVLPATPVPSSPVRVPVPTRIEVPAIGVDERLSGRGLKADGSLDTPDFGEAGWYRPGPRPGEPGGAVVVAHVHGPDGPDVFWDLATLEPGDEIRIHRSDAIATFVVDAVEDVPKDALPYPKIWPATDQVLLRLITCGGKRDPQQGYPDNTVVYAHLAAEEAQ